MLYYSWCDYTRFSILLDGAINIIVSEENDRSGGK
jgi:hypothetical protein